MTDSHPTPASIASQIDALVGQQANPQPVTVRQNVGGQRLNADGTFETWGEQPTSDRLPDNGLDVRAAGAQIITSIQARENALAEQVFDPATGKPSYKLTGIERDKAVAALAQARKSAEYDLQRLNALQAQRDADKAREVSAQAEQHASIRFANGNQARADALAEAILRAEADEAARLIVAARRAR